MALLPLVMACYATPDTADSQTPAGGDSLRVVLRWGPLGADSTGTGPAREVRWNWNGQIIRLDTVARLVDSVTVPAPTPGTPDTLVVALWPVEEGPATLRRMEILDARVLAQRHDGVVPAVLTLDERRRRVPPAPASYTPPPPPPPPPPGGTDLTLDFDDPNNLGVTCGSGVCNWPYRKHDYWPTGGVNGSGAINMHWSPNMVVGSSPVYVRTGSTARHFRISYRVKQSAIMSTSGSRQKMMRLWSDGNPFRAVGMLENTRGNLCWHWEGWDTRPLSSCVGIGQGTFNDDQWHTYTIEVDYRNTADFVVTLSFDGVVGRTLHLDARAAGNLYNGLLIVSPMVEMFSCGVVSGPCGAGNPTVAGDYTVDDFSFTVLP